MKYIKLIKTFKHPMLCLAWLAACLVMSSPPLLADVDADGKSKSQEADPIDVEVNTFVRWERYEDSLARITGKEVDLFLGYPGQTFKDCPTCPEMVAIPLGGFVFGASPSEVTWSRYVMREYAPTHSFPMLLKLDYKEQKIKEIDYVFAVGKYEITLAEFKAFVKETGVDPDELAQYPRRCFLSKPHQSKFEDSRQANDISVVGKYGFDPFTRMDDRHPVTCIDRRQIDAYLSWLSKKSGRKYRLLTELEWEYVAKAGTTTFRYWGDDKGNALGCRFANVSDKAHHIHLAKTNGNFPRTKDFFACEDGFVFTAPVGRSHPNMFGLYDMLGNVAEHVDQDETKGLRYVRGGAWASSPWYATSSAREYVSGDLKFNHIGFRVAVTIWER